MRRREVKYIGIYYDRARRGYSLSVVVDDIEGGGEALVRLDGSRIDLEPGAIINEVTALLEEEQAQEILNDLWASGLRPDGYRGGDEVVEAVREQVEHKDQHIEDLRYFARLATAHAVLVNIEEEEEQGDG